MEGMTLPSKQPGVPSKRGIETMTKVDKNQERTYPYRVYCINCGADYEENQDFGKERPAYNKCAVCGCDANTSSILRKVCKDLNAAY